MKSYFGGTYGKNKRKARRPLDFKKSTHLVLRLKENLPNLLSPRDLKLRQGFVQLAKKYEIRVYQLVFNHSHLHAVLLIPNRKAYVAFIREFSAKVVRYLSRVLKVKLQKIFQNRPFTRIVTWGRAYQKILQYMKKNELESGVQQFEDRTRAFKHNNSWLSVRSFATY